jgi:hypothetical protein
MKSLQAELNDWLKILNKNPAAYDFLYSIGVWLYFPLKAVEK